MNVEKHKEISKKDIDFAINQLQNSIIPKIVSHISNKSAKKSFESKINLLLPKKSLNYPDTQTFMKEKGLVPFDIVLTSIKATFPDMNQKDQKLLASFFMPMAVYYNVRLEKLTGRVFFKEVFFILGYIKEALCLLETYPKYWNNFQGTKFRSSSEKNIIKAQIKYLKNRLDHPYFPLSCQEERWKTKVLINFIELLAKPNYRHIAEWIAYLDHLFFLDILTMAGLSTIEIDAVKQTSNFFNGIRSKKHEIIKSIGIYIQMQLSGKTLSAKEKRVYAEVIQNILEFFFKQKYANELNKKGIYFLDKNFNRTPVLKTFLGNFPLFKYQTSRQQIDPIERAMVEFIEAVSEINHDSNHHEEISKYKMKKNLYLELTSMNFTKDDIRALITFFTMIDNQQEQPMLPIHV